MPHRDRWAGQHETRPQELPLVTNVIMGGPIGDTPQVLTKSWGQSTRMELGGCLTLPFPHPAHTLHLPCSSSSSRVGLGVGRVAVGANGIASANQCFMDAQHMDQLQKKRR